MRQLPLDLSKTKALTGKRTKRVTFTCSDEFFELVEKVEKLTGLDRSKLGHKYFLDGMLKDFGKILMAEPHLELSLRDIIDKFF